MAIHLLQLYLPTSSNYTQASNQTSSTYCNVSPFNKGRASFFFLPSCELRQCQPDFLWYFVEVCCFIQLKIHQKFKFAEIPRTFHLQNDKNKSNLLILLKYFVKFPVRQSISCEQSSQVHWEKTGLHFTLHERGFRFCGWKGMSLKPPLRNQW